MWLWLVFCIIQCLVAEIWKLNWTLSYICASILRQMIILILHINSTVFLCRNLPQPQQNSSDTCQLINNSHSVCCFGWHCGLGQHLCGSLRFDSMKRTCMFSKLEVAFCLAKWFCEQLAFSLATDDVWWKETWEKLYFPSVFCEESWRCCMSQWLFGWLLIFWICLSNSQVSRSPKT